MDEVFFRPLESRKAKAMETCEEIMRKNVEYTEDVVATYQYCNEIIQAQHEMTLFTQRVHSEEKETKENLSLMIQRALSRAQEEVAKDGDNF